MRARDEQRLEREILVGTCAPDVWLQPNQVGQGYYGALGPQLCPTCRDLAMRCRLTYGLGAGSPDLFGAVGGRALGLELKTDTGRLSPEQIQWHAAAHARGVDVVVVRSLAEAKAAVDAARRRP